MAKKKLTRNEVRSAGFDLALRKFLGVSPVLTAVRYFFESLKYVDNE
tara:strand:+ start:296 stop:436 length:141 start_codon:yes stop_codon:yes gene_type:complete